MHMPDGYSQNYRLIDEPRHIEYSFVLGHHDGIIFLRVFASEPDNQAGVGLYRLLHVVKASVASNDHRAYRVNLTFEKAGCLAYRHRHMQRTLLHLCIVQGLEVTVTKSEIHRRFDILQTLQVNLQEL